MRICIYGAGAGGGHLAVRLALAGHEVAVVARGAHLDAIRQQGLTMQQGEARLHARVAASDQPSDLGPQDLVIVTVKATALASVADGIAPLLAPHTPVLFVQNGMPWWYGVGLPQDRPALPSLPIFELAPRFLSCMTEAQVLGGILYTANELIAPGVVRNNSPTANGVEIGPASPAGAGAAAQCRAVLEQAGLQVPAIDDIRTSVWVKLVGNACSSSIAVITGNARAAATEPAVRAVFLRAVREASAVAAAHGYPIEGRLDLSRWGSQRGGHKPSLLQDYEHGRPMEIGEMVVAPAAFAEAAGVDAPTLAALAALAAQRARDRGLYATG